MIKKHLMAAAMVSLLAANYSYGNGPTKYDIDTNHSTVGFSVPILGGLSRVRGKFMDFTVTIVYDEADVTKSSVSTVIKTASINTGIERRDNHLRTADFFDAEKYPEITFQSKRIEKKGDQLLAVGTFTMRGVTKEIALPFTITGKYTNPANGKTNLGVATKLTLNRQDYGIAWRHKEAPDFVGDEVEIDIALITKAAGGQAASGQ